MGILDQQLKAGLESLERRQLFRSLRVIDTQHGPSIEYQRRRLLMLSSNNYLDLAGHPELKRAAAEAVARYGVGSGASRLIAGSLAPLHQLERCLAEFKGTEAAVVFGSGYLANIGTIAALAGPEDVVLSDELNHASLIDGCRLSRARVLVYRHRDIDHLRSLLVQCPSARRRLIVTDSVFSMDGDFAPLCRIVDLARQFEAATLIDEAHAVGVVGANGEGLAAHLGLQDKVDVQIGTLSKALGGYGAYVAGSRLLIEYLINSARSFIYTTGLAPALAAAACQALELLRTEAWRRERLWSNAAFLREKLTHGGFAIAASDTPILPVMIGDAGRSVAMANCLMEHGVYVIAIRPPTVPDGTARLRVTPTAGHSQDDLLAAVDAFLIAGRRTGVI